MRKSTRIITIIIILFFIFSIIGVAVISTLAR